MNRSFNKFIPWTLQLVPLLIIAMGFFISARYYPLLPDSIPSGLTATGNITNYVDRSWYRVHYLPLISVVLYIILMSFAYYFLVRNDDPGQHLGLTPGLRRKISKNYLENYRTRSIWMIFSATTCLLGALTATNLVLMRSAMGSSIGIFGYLPWFFYLGALIFAFLYYLSGRQMKKIIRQAAG